MFARKKYDLGILLSVEYQFVTGWFFFSVAAGSKRKFWNPRKWFKRKQKSSEDGGSGEVLEQAKDALRSRSTSELSIAEEQTRRR